MLKQTIADNFHATCDDSTRFAKEMLMIQDKSRKLVPFVHNRAQLHYSANRTRRDLLLKARQLGLSTYVQGELTRIAWTRPISSLTMADDRNNTNKLKRMAQRFYDHLPPSLPKPRRSEANAAITVYPAIGSEMQIATAGSQTSGRAGTVTHLHGSEVAYWKNADWMISGALQAVPEHLEDTWVVFESTANGAQGWFYQECMNALQGDSEWTLHFYAWWWDDDYQIPLLPDETITYTDEEQALASEHDLSASQIKWRRKKQRDLKAIFQQEYPESPQQAFLTSGGGVFTLQAENVYTGDTARYEGNTAYYMQAPVEGAIYVAGMDWGQDNDYTTLSIWRVETGKAPCEVYLNRWRKQSWYVMRGYIIDQLEAYAVEKIIAEKNAASSNIENLIDDIESRELITGVQSFVMSNQSKDKIVKLMQNGLEEHGSLLLDIDYANHEMRTFQTKQTSTGMWAYSHPNGGHDDCVDARLLANYGATQLWI